MFDVLTLPFVQRGIWEILLLAVGAGVIGTWIVARGLAFYTHAVGTATFPGLVLADGLGFAASLGAAVTGLLVAAGVGAIALSNPGDDAQERHDAATALVLVGALALGVILASDVFDSAASVDTLLFGSLLVIDDGDLLLAGIASVAVLVANQVLGPRWLVVGFDPHAARALGVRSPLPDLVLLALVALVSIAVLSAVGALLATALIVVPAATMRLLVTRMRTWQLATVALVAVQGVAGLWLSVELNAPPGATIAVLGATLFAVVAVGRSLGARRSLAAVAVAVAAAGVAGCGDGGGADDGRVKVVATTTQLADLARTVGGDRVTVIQLLHPGSDPHDYEPRPSDLRDAAGAALMLVSGDGLDDWADQVAEQSGIQDTVIDVGAERPVRVTGEGGTDPHWWHDPANVLAAVVVISRELKRVDPAGAPGYTARAGAYGTRIHELDHRIETCMERVPARRRKLVSDHDAFAYFTRAYGITFVGAVIPSTTSQAQASAGELAALARLVEREDVAAIFPESSLNPRLAKALAQRTGAAVGGTLYADTLGPPGSAGETYLGAMRANADALARGFTNGGVTCG